MENDEFAWRRTVGETVLEVKRLHRRDQRNVHGVQITGEYVLTMPDRNPSSLSLTVQGQFLGGMPEGQTDDALLLLRLLSDQLATILSEPGAKDSGTAETPGHQ